MSEQIGFRYGEAAAILGIGESTLQKIKESVPRIEIGGTVSFAMQDLIEIQEMHRKRPATVRTAPVDLPDALLDLRPRRARKSA